MTVDRPIPDVPVPAGASRVEDAAELAEFFGVDRAAHLYSLVDLEEPYWSSSTWFRRGDATVGIIANPTDGLVTATAVSTRDPAGSLRLVAEVAAQLPAGLEVTGPPGLGTAIATRRAVRRAGPHVKYEWTDRSFLGGWASTAVDQPGGEPVRSLGPEHLALLTELYAIEPGAAFFLPSTVYDRSFVGVIGPDGRLVAAAGTHVVSERQRLAALGSVYVRPDHRGRGLGRLVSAATLVRLADRCDVIGLNVAADNAPARAIYESLGFRPVLDYEEVELA